MNDLQARALCEGICRARTIWTYITASIGRCVVLPITIKSENFFLKDNKPSSYHLYFPKANPHSMKTSTVSVLSTALLAGLSSATLEPAKSNSKGVCPTDLKCSAAKVSTAIQAAECSHNTRTSEQETFAVFRTDHQYDSSHGAPYGTCSAYTCTPPTKKQMTDKSSDCWTFFWEGNAGKSEGVGTGCIKSPDNGECGCEDSTGQFIAGSDSCH